MKSACVAAVLLVGTAAAQDVTATRSLCLKPQPAPSCSAVFLTNFGGHALVGSATGRGVVPRVLVDWGLLVNIDQRSSVGATWLLSLDQDTWVTGPMARYRHWFNDSASIELGVGIPVGKSHDTYASAVGLIKWNPMPNIGFAIRPELRHSTDYTCLLNPPYMCTPYSRSSLALSAGVELSGVPGLALSALSGAVLAAFAAVLSSVSD